MLREECTRERSTLAHERPEDFFICFWQRSLEVKILWIVHRVVIVLYFSTAGLVIVIIRDLEDSPWYKNAIFFYYWVYFVELVAFVLALIIVVKRYLEQRKNPIIPPMEKMPWYYKLLWLTYTVAASSAAVITFVFCIFIYTVDSYSYLNYAIITHFCNTLTIFYDFCLSAIPIRLLHAYIPFVFSVIYGIFSLIYQSCGGTGNQGKIPIYRILDWREPLQALRACVVHLIIILLAHSGYYVLYVVKHYLKKKVDDRETGIERRANS